MKNGLQSFCTQKAADRSAKVLLLPFYSRKLDVDFNPKFWCVGEENGTYANVRSAGCSQLALRAQHFWADVVIGTVKIPLWNQQPQLNIFITINETRILWSVLCKISIMLQTVDCPLKRHKAPRHAPTGTSGNVVLPSEAFVCDEKRWVIVFILLVSYLRDQFKHYFIAIFYYHNSLNF